MLHPSGKPEGSKKRAKVSRDLYRKGCANTLEEGLSSSQKIGYPVMIKASEGGGGKGIRKVESAEEFPKQYAQVSLALFSFLALFGPFTESAQVSAIIFDLGDSLEMSGCRSCYDKNEEQVYYKSNAKKECQICVDNNWYLCGAYPLMLNKLNNLVFVKSVKFLRNFNTRFFSVN